MNFWSVDVSFWIGAALLCAIAVGAIVTPWFLRAKARVDRREAVIAFAKTRLAEIERDFQSGVIGTEAYHQLTLEQQRRLLQEADAGTDVDAAGPAQRRGRALLIVFACAAPIFAGVFYYYSGDWPDWRVQQLLDRSAQEVRAGDDNRATLEKMRAALERRLALRDDEDGRRRFMLAQLDMEFERYGGAAEQFGLILKRFPDDAGIAAKYAQALYLASDRQLTPEVMRQARHALQLDPDQTTALGLLGIAAFERKDFAQALLYWRHLLRLLPPDAPGAAMIGHGIAQAEQALGPDGFPGPKFAVSVSIAPRLAAAVPKGGMLFVFAKAVDGPPMPLAVARFDASKLPLAVTLDNSMAMAPNLNLSSAKQVRLFARITASGQVRGEPGDLEGDSQPLAVTDSAQQVALVIDRRLEAPAVTAKTSAPMMGDRAGQQSAAGAVSGTKLVVSVSVAPDLASAVPQGGTLFVFAKAVGGPPMPLAVARFQASQLPLQVTLDDSMAMAPGMNLSSVKQVQVFARITASGQVRGEPGDLEGSSQPLTLAGGEQKLTLKIDRKL